jgi:hypothetical protein
MSKKRSMDMDVLEPLVARAYDTDAQVAPGELPMWLRRSRTVDPASTIVEPNADTIRILQRANAHLKRRFGIDWADAAVVVFNEAHRRGASPTAIARVLTAGLRRDARRSRGAAEGGGATEGSS